MQQQHLKLLDKTVFGRAQFKPPFKAHSALYDEARFVTIVKGNTKLYVPNNRIDLSSSDSILMKCDNFVNNWLPNEDDQPSEVIVTHFYPEVLQYIYNNNIPSFFTSKSDVKPLPAEKISSNQMIENFDNSLRFYFDHPNFATEEMLKIKFQELINILLSSDPSGKIKSILSGLFQTGEYEFKEIIHSHLFEDLSLQDLAFFAGLSLSSFKRKFKTVFETSPIQYIKGKRLEAAKNLLETTTERISDIAYDCGFNDVAYFSRAFSTKYKASPSEYRKQHLV